MIRRVKKEDDLHKVAELIYESDGRIFSKLFGAKQKAINGIESLILLENNTFSYRHILCLDDGHIKGVLISYDFEDIDPELEEADYIKTFSLLRAVKVGMVYGLYRKLLTRFERGYYIECFSVEKDEQGKGIGSKLIKHLFDNLDTKHKKVYLDVSILNTRAVKLYKHLGFDIVSKKVLTPDLSTYVMRKTMN